MLFAPILVRICARSGRFLSRFRALSEDPPQRGPGALGLPASSRSRRAMQSAPSLARALAKNGLFGHEQAILVEIADSFSAQASERALAQCRVRLMLGHPPSWRASSRDRHDHHYSGNGRQVGSGFVAGGAVLLKMLRDSSAGSEELVWH